MKQFHYYRDETYYHRFVEDYGFRTVGKGVKVDFEAFRRCGVADLLSFQGWERFLTAETPYLEPVVRLFYGNLSVTIGEDAAGEEETVSLTSSVYGNEFTVTDDQLLCWLEARPGLRFYSTSKRPVHVENRPEWGPSKQLEAICQPHLLPTTGDIAPPASLTPTASIIWYIVRHVILPRGGHDDKLTALDQFIVFLIVSKEPVHLGYLIMKQLAKAHAFRNGTLIYPDIVHFMIAHLMIECPDTGDWKLVDKSIGDKLMKKYQVHWGLSLHDVSAPNEQPLASNAGTSAAGSATHGSSDEAPLWFKKFEDNVNSELLVLSSELTAVSEDLRTEITTIKNTLASFLHHRLDEQNAVVLDAVGEARDAVQLLVHERSNLLNETVHNGNANLFRALQQLRASLAALSGVSTPSHSCPPPWSGPFRRRYRPSLA